MRTELQTCARNCLEARGGGVNEPLLIRTHPPKAMAVTLLKAAKLPTEDLRDEMLPHFFYVRSLVLESQARGLGLGKS